MIVIDGLTGAGTHRTCPVRHTSLWNDFKSYGLWRLKRAQMRKIHVQALMRVAPGRRSTGAPVGLFESDARSSRPSPSRASPCIRIGGPRARGSRPAAGPARRVPPISRPAGCAAPRAGSRAPWRLGPDRYVLGCAVAAVGDPAGAEPGRPCPAVLTPRRVADCAGRASRRARSADGNQWSGRGMPGAARGRRPSRPVASRAWSWATAGAGS